MHISNETPFAFRKRRERIDWRKLAAVDVDKVAQDVDVQVLQENTSNVTFCDIEAEMESNSMDPNFIKLFRLAQLIIEYLMYSQECLSSALISSEKQLSDKTKDIDELKEKLQQLKTKNKTLQEKQLYLIDRNDSEHKCSLCPKVFLTEHFLQLHLQRRHNGRPSGNSEFVDAGAVKALEIEISELKGRLATAENAFQSEKASNQAAIAKEVAENAQKETELKKEMEKWKEEQVLNHTKELNSVREMFLSELKLVNEKHLNAELQLKELAKKNEPQSNLGLLIDEEEVNLELMKRQKSQLLHMKEQLELQLAEVKNGVYQQLSEQEKNWKTKLHKLEQNHSNQISQLLESFNRKLGETVSDGQHMESRLKKQVKKLEALSQKQRQKIDYQEKKMKELNKSSMVHSSPVIIPPKPLSDLNLTGETSNYQTLESDEELPDLSMAKLKDSVKHNPIIIRGMRRELADLLDQKLENIGISKDAMRVKDSFLTDTLATQVKERKKMKRYKSLQSLREQLHYKVEQLAKKKLKQRNSKSTPSSGLSVQKSFKNMSDAVVAKIKSVAVRSNERGLPVSGRNSSVEITDNKKLPKSPEKEEEEKGDEEYDSDDVMSESDISDRYAKSELKPITRSLSSTKVQWERDTNSVSEDSSSDSLDSERQLAKQFEISSISKASPKGLHSRTGSVPELASSLEFQMESHRRKPPGGVDIMPVKQTPNASTKDNNVAKVPSNINANGSSASLGITNDTTKAKSWLISKGETENSSNTAATSVWGSSVSNQGATKIPDMTSRPTSSLVSVSSWDSEDSISELS